MPIRNQRKQNVSETTDVEQIDDQPVEIQQDPQKALRAAIRRMNLFTFIKDVALVVLSSVFIITYVMRVRLNTFFVFDTQLYILLGVMAVVVIVLTIISMASHENFRKLVVKAYKHVEKLKSSKAAQQTPESAYAHHD